MTHTVVGRITAPKGFESSPEEAHFWADPGQRIEKACPVVITSDPGGGEGPVEFLGVVDEVRYQSSEDSIHEDRLRCQRGPDVTPPGGQVEGTAYFRVQVLKTKPDLLVAPVAGSLVRRATPEEAQEAYGMDGITRGIPFGLLRAGAIQTAGPLLIDAAYALGENGAHLNANGTSGVATKTSALLTFIRSALAVARREHAERPSDLDRFTPVPVLFNVKGPDLLYIDQASRKFTADPSLRQTWEEMGVEPGPFRGAHFFVPGLPRSPSEPRPLAERPGLKAYNWGLGDVVERGLFSYLFADSDMENQNFRFLLNLWRERLTQWRDGGRQLSPHGPQTFRELADEVGKMAGVEDTGSRRDDFAHRATAQAFFRRLRKIQREAAGVLVWDEPYGRPPEIRPRDGFAPHVIDLASLAGSPDTQRFVIAAVMDDLVGQRTAPGAPRGLRFLVMLDELNRWAPRGSRDPVTRLIENIASEMRSMGIVLCGAQQFASEVSKRVPENSAIRIMGHTGTGELTDELYRFLTPADRRMVSRLRPGEMLVHVPTFRAPAYARLPFPCWATGPEDVLSEDIEVEGHTSGAVIPRRGIRV